MKRTLSTVMWGMLGLAAAQAQASICSSYAGAGESWKEGATVCFVYDPNDIDSLYGTPSVSGDTIFVTPTDFKAEALDDSGTAITSGTGTVQIIAKPGYVLDAINFRELGDYKMVSSTGSTSVDVDPWLRVFDWTDPLFGQEETMTVPVTGDLTIADGNFHDWSAAGSFDLTTAAWDGKDHVGLTLQNTLTAISTVVGESAFIQKKAIGAGIEVTTSPVPVPAAVWLFGSGLLGLVGVARRRS